MTVGPGYPGNSCALVAQAALYRIGDLNPAEARTFEEHLEACSECRAELEDLDLAVEAVAFGAGEVQPPAHLLPRLMSRVRDAVAQQPWKAWEPDASVPEGLAFSWAKDAEWESTSIDGIEVRRLHADPARDRVSMLVRMAPGTAYPAHRHGGFEECYVLQGDLCVGEHVMHEGDYQQVSAGDVHGVQSTEGGCLLMISSSMSDEFI